MPKIAALVPLLLLAACDAEVRAPAAGDETVQLKADADGRVAFNLPFANGEIKLPAAMMTEGKLDIDGVELPQGSRMSGFNLDAREGQGAKVNLSFTSPMTPQAVTAYFAEQFRAKGVDVRLSGDALEGTSKDGQPFVMRFKPEASGTSGTISIDAKE